MDTLVASVDGVKFDVESQIELQVGISPLPFPGMDKTVSPICLNFFNQACSLGNLCPYRHIIGDKTVVCKHWLRGLCKKGDDCEFLHEFDMTKMPECYFYSRFNACHNKECPFLHIDPESKIRDCPWYDRGFCRHGPLCRHRHTRRVMCMNYLAGFCPEGPDCKHVHPSFDLPVAEEFNKPLAKKGVLVCHHCHEPGHKVMQCPKLTQEEREAIAKAYVTHGMGHLPAWATVAAAAAASGNLDRPGGFGPFRRHGHGQEQNAPMRPLEEVTCFKCGGKGHYANKCPKGHLAFLSSDLKNVPQQKDMLPQMQS